MKYRLQIRKIQRWYRSFAQCQQARLDVLRRVWDSIGKKLLQEIKQADAKTEAVQKKLEQTSRRASSSRRASTSGKLPALAAAESASAPNLKGNLKKATLEQKLQRKYAGLTEFLNTADGELMRHEIHFQTRASDDAKRVQERRASYALKADGQRQRELQEVLRRYRKYHIDSSSVKYEEARSAFINSHVHAGMHAILGEHGIERLGENHPKWPPLVCYSKLRGDAVFLQTARKLISERFHKRQLPLSPTTSKGTKVNA